MLKSSFPDLPWSQIDAIGFDLDGTLYDEKLFIEQVYRPISVEISGLVEGGSHGEFYQWMLDRWIEKGSSYPYIFSETVEHFPSAADAAAIDDIISVSLDIFRGFSPVLELNEAVRMVLDEAADFCTLFLVTDGQSRLQREKMRALGLGKWFAPGMISISGDYGAEFAKPSGRIIENLEYFERQREPDRVVYFGDRDVDRQFAKNCGFLYRQVKLMTGADK
jgi:FMN phosphatase YigB (HAD superfamily)